MKGDVIGSTLPHAAVGARDCNGYLYGIEQGQWADIVCNGCDAVIRTVPAAELPQVLSEMERAAPVRSRAAGIA